MPLGKTFKTKDTAKAEEDKTLKLIVEGGLPDYIPDGPAAFMNMPIPPDYAKAWEEYSAAQNLVDKLSREIQDLETHYRELNQAKYNINSNLIPFNGD